LSATGATGASSPAPSSAIVTGAIIGGCVGGLLIIGAIVAFVAIRKRKSKSIRPTPAATHATKEAFPPREPREYVTIPLKAMGADYDLGGISEIPPNASADYGNAGLQNYGDGRLDPNL
jgi:hypothetical protein